MSSAGIASGSNMTGSVSSDGAGIVGLLGPGIDYSMIKVSTAQASVTPVLTLCAATNDWVTKGAIPACGEW